jgi:hypothetical protein
MMTLAGTSPARPPGDSSDGGRALLCEDRALRERKRGSRRVLSNRDVKEEVP